jgi:arginine utilization regulatory protein
MASRSSSNVLIIGESGTEKELFAEAIHNASDRRSRPYIVENCAAIPATLLESLLFGTAKGAFTGAIDRIGLFQQADGGTLVLDEINSMPMSLQSKLLRVLQEGRFRPIGGEKEEEVNVRIIAITNKDPLELIRKGKLREDLFYRLSVVNLFIPPLRKRGKEDIDLLTEFFIKNISGELMKRDITISDEMMEYFYSYSWPGNVRELENIIEGAINLLNDGEKITLRHLPYYLKNDVKFLEGFPRDTKSNSIESIIEEDISLHDYLDCIEKEIVKEALDMADGNVTKAAKILKITRQSLQYKIDKK